MIEKLPCDEKKIQHFIYDNFEHIDNFIIDITNVPFIDMTGLVALKSMISSIANEKRHISIVCNIHQVERKIQKKIFELPMAKYVSFFKTIPDALQAKVVAEPPLATTEPNILAL